MYGNLWQGGKFKYKYPYMLSFIIITEFILVKVRIEVLNFEHAAKIIKKSFENNAKKK